MPIPANIERILGNITDIDDLLAWERNPNIVERWNRDMEVASGHRGSLLLRPYVAQQAGLSLVDLTPAQERIVQVVCDYVLIKKRAGTNAGRTLEQIRNRGLIEAAEVSVCRGRPTQGYETLVDEGQESLSYEQIIVDHPEEFTDRAVWYARRTLGLQNDFDHPPTASSSRVQVRTTDLVRWLRNRAAHGHGLIEPYTNAEAAAAIGLGDMARYGRVQGNIQSRLDFACWRVGLPPLGLTARECFANAWGLDDRSWPYPVDQMRVAAQGRRWTHDDFNRIESALQELSGQAHTLWRREMETRESELKAWAFGLNAAAADDGQLVPHIELPDWPDDAVLLLLDAYLQANGVDIAAEAAAALATNLRSLSVALDSQALAQVTGEDVLSYLQRLHRIRSTIATGVVDIDEQASKLTRLMALGDSDPTRVHATASAIRSLLIVIPGADRAPPFDEPEVVQAPEGLLLTREHRYRERDQSLVRACKARALQKHGRLVCEACGFSFAERYGPEAAGIIECHHRQPLHTLPEHHLTHIDDLALLCANCHRVIHATRDWISVDELRARIDRTRP